MKRLVSKQQLITQSKTLSVILSIALVTGCSSLAPDYKVPELVLDQAFSQYKPATEQTSTSIQADQTWWQQYQDPALTQLIDAVLKQNLSIKITAERIQQARAQLGVASSIAFPQGNLIFDAGRQGGSEHSALTFTSQSYNDYQFGFDTAWELDLFGRVSSTKAAANWQLNAADASLADLQRVLSSEVAKIYIRYRVLQQQLSLAEQSVEIQQQSLTIAQALRRDGPATELDVQQATAILAETQALLPQLTMNKQLVKNALISLLGVPASQLDAWLPNTNGTIPTLSGEIAAITPAQLLTRRPDIRRADFNARAAAAAVGIAKAEQYPSIQLIGSLRLRSTSLLPNEANPTGGSNFSDLFDASALSFKVGPSISFPLLDFGRTENQAKSAESQYTQALDGYRMTVWKAIEEVENAKVQLAQTEQRVVYLQSSAQAFDKALKIAQIQYREGETSFQSVLDSMRASVRQQQNVAMELGNIAIAQINLFKALGGGWTNIATPTTN